ncbi:S8 family serine peptidase [Candidatus Pelagibacter bacterium]|nr:S8 family serine peptidase [Candidatus Pelagibacter bacterium]
MNNISKILAILSLPLLLNACGGGGGGAAGGAVGSSPVSACTDTGTAFHTNEYKRMGNGTTGSLSPLAFVCASNAYAKGYTGDGVKVGVIDTGVLTGGTTGYSNTTHTDLDGNHATFTSGSDARYSDDTPNDYNGHGTHVAGIIAAEKNDSGMHGIAYDATLYTFRAMDSSGVGTATHFANSMQNSINADVDIINNSWNANFGSDGVADASVYTDGTCTTVTGCRNIIGSTFYDKMVAAGNSSKINVWAAGNESKAHPHIVAGAAIYDSRFSETTVVVVATDTVGTYGGGSTNPIASYSNKCGNAKTICIAAPGTSVYSTSNDGTTNYETLSGTSMAAPLVSGGLAIIKEQFTSLTNAQVVDRLFATATDTGIYSDSSIYGHGLMNLSQASTAVAELQAIGGDINLDGNETKYYNLNQNNFTSSASFSNALNSALVGQMMEVYDSFDRANFTTEVSSFFTPGSYTSQNTIENHMFRLQPKTTKKTINKNLYGSLTVETDGNYIESSMFQSTGDFLALGFNQSTNSFENAVDPLSNFFNDNNFGNNYLANPYFNTGSGQDYFMSFNSNGSFGFDTFTNANGNDLGLAFNLNPLSNSNEGKDNAGDLQIVFGANYEQNKFLNSTSTGVFATGDLSNTNFTGVKYKKNLGNDFTFVGSGFAGYTYIDKAADSYIDSSTPLLTSEFTLGLAKANFIKEDQRIGFFINQPQRVEDGSINLRVPTSSDRDRTVTYSNLNVDLEPNSRQINFDIIFNKTITESSNLSANLTHVKDGDHSKQKDGQNFFSIFYQKTF